MLQFATTPGKNDSMNWPGDFGAPCDGTGLTQAIFRTFDPVKGAGAELFRVHVESQTYFGWDLSPDGTKLAICKSRNGPVQILSLDGRLLREIKPAELQNMRSLDWAANGQGLYIANSAQQGVDLYYVDLNFASSEDLEPAR